MRNACNDPPSSVKLGRWSGDRENGPVWPLALAAPMIAVLGERTFPMFHRGSFLKKRSGAAWQPSIGLWVLAGWVLSAAVFVDGPVCRAEPPSPGRPIARLEVFPAKVRLFGPEASQRLVVLGVGPDGSRRDVTAEAKLESRSPERVKVDGDGAIRPVADGTAEVVVRFEDERDQGARSRSRGRPGRGRSAFATRSCPLLTKLGCNQGACHGGAARQGRVQALAPGLRARGRLHGDRQERRGTAGHAVRSRGELALAQADAGRGARRRQEDGGRFARLPTADALAGTRGAGPARRRSARRRASRSIPSTG